MEVQKDFRELLALFNENNVEYLIVGAYALAYHGAPRYTGDIDILINPSSKNAEHILCALDKFGFGSLGLKIEDFIYPEKVIQFGVPPVRIDIITSLTGISWEEAIANREKGLYDNIEIYYIGKKELILNKRAIGRKKDIADIEALGEE